ALGEPWLLRLRPDQLLNRLTAGGKRVRTVGPTLRGDGSFGAAVIDLHSPFPADEAPSSQVRISFAPAESRVNCASPRPDFVADSMDPTPFARSLELARSSPYSPGRGAHQHKPGEDRL